MSLREALITKILSPNNTITFSEFRSDWAPYLEELPSNGREQVMVQFDQCPECDKPFKRSLRSIADRATNLMEIGYEVDQLLYHTFCSKTCSNLAYAKRRMK